MTPNGKTSGNFILRVLLFLACVFVSVGTLRGQYASIPQPGLPPGADFSHGEIDSVNLTTGNLYVHIPVLSYPQAGGRLQLNFFLRFNNPQWAPSISTVEQNNTDGQPIYKGRWLLNSNLASGAGVAHPIGVDVVRDQGITLQKLSLNFMCVAADQTGPGDCYTGDSATHYGGTGQAALGQYYSQTTEFLVRDRSGAEHPVMASGGGNPKYGTLAIASPDGSGWTVATPSSQPNQFADRSGNIYTVRPLTDSSGGSIGNAVNISDTNGNTITSDASGWNDSAGRHIPGSYSGPGTGFSLPNQVSSSSQPFENDPFPGVAAAQMPAQCGSGTTSARIWDVPGINNSTAHYVLCYSLETAAPAFPTTQLNHYAASLENSTTSGELLTQFVLPNGTGYSFTYDSYFDLQSITLPTGATISYTWTTIPWDGSSLSQPLVRAITSRKEITATGEVRQWSYNWSTVSDYYQTYGNVPGNITVTATVTKPDLNDEVHTTRSMLEGATSTTTYWNGSAPSNPSATAKGSLLRTEVAEHQILQSPFAEPLPDLPPATNAGGRYHANWSFQDTYVGPITTLTTTLDDNTTSQVVNTPVPATTITYEKFGLNRYFQQDQDKLFTCQCLQYGQIQASSVYDYGTAGQSAPGALLRSTRTTFKWNDGSSNAGQYLNANLLDLVTSLTVSDASGNLAKETDYSFDDANGSPQGYRGNLTHISYRTALTSSAQSPATFIGRDAVFNSNGTHKLDIDGNGNQTLWDYQCASSLPSMKSAPYKSATPQADTTSFIYDCGAGKLTDTTDVLNNVAQHFQYDVVGRVTNKMLSYASIYYSTQYYAQDRANQSITYPSMLETDVAQDENSPNDGVLRSANFTDGLGHIVRTVNPSGYIVDTSYDPVWRVQSVTNPYVPGRGGLAGTLSFSYDGLGRKRLQCNQENGSSGTSGCSPGASFKAWSYHGNAVLEQDENSNQTTTRYDAVGRLSSVLSADGGRTAYSYDALDNLVQVTQSPSSGTATQRRTFSYDGLSRLLWAYNPESGFVCYGSGDGTRAGCQANGYDGNGNLLHKTDARGITTSYTYDGLDRLTSKTFSDNTTPTACFLYDGLDELPNTHTVGRLVAEWTQSGPCPTSSIVPPATGIYTRKLIGSYDALGNVLTQQVCARAGCTAEHGQIYMYDLVGKLSTYTDGLTSNSFILSYDSGGKLSSLSMSGADPTHPATLFHVTESGPFGWDRAILGSSISSARSFDVRGRVVNLTVKAGTQ